MISHGLASDVFFVYWPSVRLSIYLIIQKLNLYYFWILCSHEWGANETTRHEMMKQMGGLQKSYEYCVSVLQYTPFSVLFFSFKKGDRMLIVSSWRMVHAFNYKLLYSVLSGKIITFLYTENPRQWFKPLFNSYRRFHAEMPGYNSQLSFFTPGFHQHRSLEEVLTAQ